MSAPIPVLVAAAGGSTRCPGGKLLTELAGRPLLSWLLERLSAHPRLGEILVVTGHQAPQVEALMAPFPSARGLFNPSWAEGLSTTLKLGVAALPPESGFLVALGDTPLFTAETLDMVLPSSLAEAEEVRQPVFQGQSGHPVYFPHWTKPSWSSLRGDQGARPLFASWGDKVRALAVEDPGVLRDFDTPADFQASDAAINFEVNA